LLIKNNNNRLCNIGNWSGQTVNVWEKRGERGDSTRKGGKEGIRGQAKHLTAGNHNQAWGTCLTPNGDRQTATGQHAMLTSDFCLLILLGIRQAGLIPFKIENGCITTCYSLEREVTVDSTRCMEDRPGLAGLPM